MNIDALISELEDQAHIAEYVHTEEVISEAIGKMRDMEKRIAELEQNYNEAGEMLHNQVRNLRAAHAEIERLASALNQAQEWVSVEERLPEEGDRVLLFVPKMHRPERGESGIVTGKKLPNIISDPIGLRPEGCLGFDEDATHWKPLTPPGD